MYAYIEDRTADSEHGEFKCVPETELGNLLCVQKDGASLAPLEGETIDALRARGIAVGVKFRYELSDFKTWWGSLTDEARAALTAGCNEGYFCELDHVRSVEDGGVVEGQEGYRVVTRRDIETNPEFVEEGLSIGDVIEVEDLDTAEGEVDVAPDVDAQIKDQDLEDSEEKLDEEEVV